MAAYGSNVTTSGSSGHVASLGITVYGRISATVTPINTTMAAYRSNAMTSGGCCVMASLGIVSWCWYSGCRTTLTARDTLITAQLSHITATGPSTGIVVMGFGSFCRVSDSIPATTITNATIITCNSTIVSSEVAFDVVARFQWSGSPLRFQQHRPVSVANWSVAILDSAITTVYEEPHGDCLMVLLQATHNGTAPSVIRDSVLNCSGLSTTEPMAPGMLFTSNVTDRTGDEAAFLGANTTGGPFEECPIPHHNQPPTPTQQPTPSLTRSLTPSATSPPTASDSTSGTISLSHSPSNTQSASRDTQTTSPSDTRTISSSIDTVTATHSHTASPSSGTTSKTGTPSVSESKGTATPTSALTPSQTASKSGTRPRPSIIPRLRPTPQPTSQQPGSPEGVVPTLPPRPSLIISAALHVRSTLTTANATSFEVDVRARRFIGNRTCLRITLDRGTFRPEEACWLQASFQSAPQMQQHEGAIVTTTGLGPLRTHWSWCFTLTSDPPAIKRETVAFTVPRACTEPVALSQDAAFSVVFVRSSAAEAATSEASSTVSTSTGVASMASTSPGGAATAQRQQLLEHLLVCPKPLGDEKLEFGWTPLRRAIGDSSLRFHLGAAFYNAALIVAIFIVGSAVVLVASCVMDHDTFVEKHPWAEEASDLRRACVLLRFPGRLLPVTAFLYQPTLTSTLIVLFHSEDEVGMLEKLGCVTVALTLVGLLVVAPFTINRAWLRRQVVFIKTREKFDAETSLLSIMYISTGRFVQRHPGSDAEDDECRPSGFLAMWGGLFEDFRPEFVPCGHIDFFLGTVAALILSSNPQTEAQCNFAAAASVLCFGLAVGVALQMPFTTKINNVFYVVITSSQLAAALFGAISLRTSSGDLRAEMVGYMGIAELVTGCVVLLWMLVQIGEGLHYHFAKSHNAIEEEYVEFMNIFHPVDSEHLLTLS